MESSDDKEEEEDESEDELTDSAYNAVDDQKSYFNGRTEKVTNIGTDTVITNRGVLLKNNMGGPNKKAGKKAESNKAPVEETTEPKINNNRFGQHIDQKYELGSVSLHRLKTGTVT